VLDKAQVLTHHRLQGGLEQRLGQPGQWLCADRGGDRRPGGKPGEIAAHSAEVYGANVSKDTISRITDAVLVTDPSMLRDEDPDYLGLAAKFGAMRT
jgi:hypothetical protein